MTASYERKATAWQPSAPDLPTTEVTIEPPPPLQQWFVLSEEDAAKVREGDTVALRIGPGGTAELLVGDNLLDDDPHEENA